MKKVMLLAAGLFMLTGAAVAQEVVKSNRTESSQKQKLTPEQRAQKNVDNLHSVASLTDEQKTKVKELALTRISKADAIRAKYKGQADQKETMHKEVEAVQGEYRQAVKALLTAEQLEKVKAKNKEIREARSNGTATEKHEVLDVQD